MMRTHMTVILHRHRYNENPSQVFPHRVPQGSLNERFHNRWIAAPANGRGGRDRSENGRVLGSTAHYPLGLHPWRFIDIGF